MDFPIEVVLLPQVLGGEEEQLVELYVERGEGDSEGGEGERERERGREREGGEREGGEKKRIRKGQERTITQL